MSPNGAAKARALGAVGWVCVPAAAPSWWGDVGRASAAARAEQRTVRAYAARVGWESSTKGKALCMALSGSLREIGPTDVIQLIAMGRKTGILTVSDAGEVISVYFRDGGVCHAVSGGLEGPEVVYELLTRSSGKFSFDATDLTCPSTIHESAENLMLEGVRRIDQWSRMKEVLPPENVRLLPVPDGQATGKLEEDTPEIQKVWELIDGQRTLADVVRDSALARFLACDAVYQLLSAGMIKAGPLATPVAEDRREVSTESIKFGDLTPELLDRIVAKISSL